MIRTAIQLKAKIRNLSQGDSTKAQTYMDKDGDSTGEEDPDGCNVFNDR